MGGALLSIFKKHCDFSKIERADFAVFFLTSIFCGFVFSCGFFLQGMLVVMAGDNYLTAGLFQLSLEGGYMSFLTYVLSILFIGLIPATFFVGLVRKRSRDVKWAMFSGFLVLTIYDVGLYILYKGQMDLLFSILCNAVGGGVAGVVCAYIVRCTQNTYLNYGILRTLKKAIANYVCSGLILISVSFLTYIFFFYPLPQYIGVTALPNSKIGVVLPKENRMDIKLREGISLFKDVQKDFSAFDNPSAHLSMKEVNWFSYGGDIGEPKFSFPSVKNAVSLSVMGVYGCDNASEAIHVYNQSKGKAYKLDLLPEDSFSISGIYQDTLLLFSEKQPISLFFPYGQPIVRAFVDDELTLTGNLGPNIRVPLLKSFYIYTSGMANPFSFIEKTNNVPENLNEFENLSISFKGKNEDKVLYLPLLAEANKCTRVDILDHAKKTNGALSKIWIKQGFVIKVDALAAVDARKELVDRDISTDGQWMKVEIPPATSLKLGDNETFLGGKKRKFTVDQVLISDASGELTVAHKKIPLEKTYLAIAGKAMDLSYDAKDKISITGRADVIVANQSLVNKSFFSGLDPAIQAIFLGTLLAVAGFMLKKYGRIAFIYIVKGQEYPL